MFTRKKSTGPRTKRPRRQRYKFLTPDLVLRAGQKVRFVASPDNPLSKAERLREEYAEIEDGDDAELSLFLQRTYAVAAQFRRHSGEFERLQAHQFWKASGQKPTNPGTSKWLVRFIVRPATTSERKLAGKYASILDGLMQDQVEISAVASRIKELGGIDAAYEAMRERTRGWDEPASPTPPGHPSGQSAAKPRPSAFRAGAVAKHDPRISDFNPPNRGAQSTPTLRLRRPSHLNRLFNSILDASAQLGRARTEAERDFFQQELRDLEVQRLEHLARLAKRYKDRQEAARWKRLDDSR